LRAKWGWIVALGVVYFIVGLIALGSVVTATVASVFVVGIMMIIAGVAEVIGAFQVKGWGKFVLWLALGALYILAGFATFQNPLLAATVLTLMLGAALVVSVILVAATAARAHHALWRRALLVIGALACAGLVAKPFVSAGERSAHSGGSASEALLSDRWISQAAALCKDASLPRLQCLRLDRDRTTVARYLLEHGGRGQRVYIGAGRHDRLLVNDVTLYFAAEAIAPTRWHDLHPGVQTTRETQAEMIAEFEARPLAFVVLNNEWDDRQEPNDSARSSGVTLLDDWLRDRFRPVLKAGSLTVLAPATTAVQAPQLPSASPPSSTPPSPPAPPR